MQRGGNWPLFLVWRKYLMTEFYLIRHGKTVFNQEGRFQGGKKDSALLKQSIEDAKKAGEYLKGTHFEAFSPVRWDAQSKLAKRFLKEWDWEMFRLARLKDCASLILEIGMEIWCLNMKKAVNLKRSLRILKILCRLRCRRRLSPVCRQNPTCC